MGILIKNITNKLNQNSKYYNINVTIKGVVLKPNEEHFFDIKQIDFTIKKLSNLKYIKYTTLKDNQIKEDNLIYDNNNLNDITVIIPTYNNTDFIDECITSIKNSKINNFNVNIIIGIDSCEKTKNHIIDNDTLYNNIDIYYFNKNVGPYIIKNTLINLSKTENIIFFDSDDTMENNLIQYVNYYLNNNSLFVNFKYADFGNNIKHRTNNFAEGVIGIKKQIFLSQNGYYPWKCAADTEFRERYEHKYGKTYRLDSILFNRRIHTTNLTKSTETGMNSNIRNKYKSLIKEFKKNKYPNPNILNVENDYYKL